MKIRYKLERGIEIKEIRLKQIICNRKQRINIYERTARYKKGE